MKSRWMGIVILFGWMGSGCEKQPVGVADHGKGVPVEQPVLLADHLGMATRIPKDADLFMAGYGASRYARALLESADEMFPLDEGAGEEAAENRREMESGLAKLGTEHFLYVAGGLGEQVGLMAQSYQDVISAFQGMVWAGILDRLKDPEAEINMDQFGDSLPADLENQLVEVFLKESRFRVPTVVVGWKPEAGELSSCLDLCRGFVDACVREVPEAVAIRFQKEGAEFAGHMVRGDVMFREVIEGLEGAVEESAETTGIREVPLSKENARRLADAMRSLEFTLACGILDERVMIYVGDGERGLEFAKTPEESLAGEHGLAWTAALPTDQQIGVCHVSGSLLEGMRKMADTSPYWLAASRSVRPPIRDIRLVAGLLEALAEKSRELHGREVSSWSMVFSAGEDYRIDARGGWLNPALDYDTPLSMEPAVTMLRPVFRAHWLAKRERKDLEWNRMELLGSLAEALVHEIMSEQETPLTDAKTRGRVEGAFREIKELNRIYRKEFRQGVGDEVAVLMDLKGEVPPFPGVSQEVIDGFTAPRFLYVRPLTDRMSVEAAGASLEKQWRKLTAWVTAEAGFNMPLIIPQKIESNGITTWYPPAPFIGGDFVPGVSMDQAHWMLGTSRAMNSGFVDAMAKSYGVGATGVVMDVEIGPLREWLQKVHEANREMAEAGLKEALDELDETVPIDSVLLRQWMDWWKSLQRFSYRHWKEDGQPRWSVKLEVAAGQ